MRQFIIEFNAAKKWHSCIRVAAAWTPSGGHGPKTRLVIQLNVEGAGTGLSKTEIGSISNSAEKLHRRCEIFMTNTAKMEEKV